MSRSSQRRGTAASRGYDARWRRARERFLKANPICAYCWQEGRVVKAYAVDHIRPHRGNEELFWDESNWAGLCRMHHAVKSGMEAHSDQSRVKGFRADGTPLDPEHSWNRE